jgi:hypothetical protein
VDSVSPLASPPLAPSATDRHVDRPTDRHVGSGTLSGTDSRAEPSGDPAAESGTAARWFGVGRSDAPNPATAGADAAAAAVAGRAAVLLVVFTSQEGDLAALLAGVRAAAGPAPQIIGCTTCGEIARDGSATETVVVAALGGAGLTVRTASAPVAEGGQRQAGTEVATALQETGRPHDVLLILGDGRIGRQHDVVRGVYSVIGAQVPLAGACSGNLTYSDGHQFHDDGSGLRIHHGGVVAAMIGSDGPIGVGVAHGWRPTGEPMNLTETSGTRIFALDHQPALDVYLRRLGADDSVTADPGGFFSFTHAHPLGLSRRGGEDIRVIQAADLSDRSVTCFADVPQGGIAWLMETDPDALIDGGAASCRQAVEGLGGARPIGVLEFDCVVRKLQLGPDGVDREIAGMREVIGDSPLAGFYSMGEIARAHGTRGMHHMTSVSVAFG